MAEPWGADPEDKQIPWGNRRYFEPKRTYSGKVIYKRKPHLFTTKDAERIIDKINWGGQTGNTDDLKKFLQLLKDLSLKMLEKILWFLDEDQVRGLYDWIYIMLGKIFNVDTSYMLPNRNKMEDLIYLLASKARLDVTIKRL